MQQGPQALVVETGTAAFPRLRQADKDFRSCQTVPMLNLLRPHLFLTSVLELGASHLQSLGVEGLLLDLDGTLKDYRAEAIPEPVRQWVGRLRAQGIRLCLVSNGKTRRIERFAQVLEAPFIAKAFKPLPLGCRRALKLLGLDRRRAAIVGDQVFADVLAGRLAGLWTILVPPTNSDEPWFTRLKRPFERQVLRWLNLRPQAAAETRAGAASVAAHGA
jgi:HAD superfamily phosphatase (TIGR01668 family)